VIEEDSALGCSVINLAETMAASTISSEHLEGSEIALGKKPGGNLF
jgi:hypothetical protein